MKHRQQIKVTFLYRPYCSTTTHQHHYWQGWVRALRVVSRIQTTDDPSLEDNDREGDMKRGERMEWNSLFTMVLLSFARVLTFVVSSSLFNLLILSRIQIQCVSLSPPSRLSAVQNTIPILKMLPETFNPHPAAQNLHHP